MIALEGTFQEARHSASCSAKIRAWPEFNCLNISNDDFEREYPLDKVKLPSRTANTPLRFEFPDGASFETYDQAAVRALLAKMPKQRQTGGKRGWILLALLLIGLAGWLSYSMGIPYLAERATLAISAEQDAQLGREALAGLDKLAFLPTTLTPQQQERGRQVFASLLGGIGETGPQRLEFRAIKDNLANIFTLPSGLVVVTDRLMNLADHDKELQAVLAHELGHAHYRHSLKMWLRTSPVELLLASVRGEGYYPIAAHVAASPERVLNSQHSRAFEDLADDFAVGVLEKRGIGPCHLVAILRKLETAHPQNPQPTPDFLSTHPYTEERIQRLQGDGKAACGP